MILLKRLETLCDLLCVNLKMVRESIMPDKNIRDKSDLAPAETDISTASLDDIQDITPSEERIAKAVIQQISYSEFQ